MLSLTSTVASALALADSTGRFNTNLDAADFMASLSIQVGNIGTPSPGTWFSAIKFAAHAHHAFEEAAGRRDDEWPYFYAAVALEYMNREEQR